MKKTLKKKGGDFNFDTMTFSDAEERDLIESIEKGEWNAKPATKAEKKYWQQVAANSIAERKKKALSLRLGERDIDRIKVKAAQKGLPYQTLIASVIHQYATGQLDEKIS